MGDFQYVGSELDLFAVVYNWKEYWSKQVRPYIAGEVLEVGAGIGSNTRYLDRGDAKRWVCLEPDSQLVEQLEGQSGKSPRCEVVCGTLQTMETGARFDTIIYIDVLEHIEHDGEELASAGGRLKPGGHVIVLSPAHQSLYTPFDAAIGHFRRYNRAMLRNITPEGLRVVRVKYLDSIGLSASIANRLFLRQSMPTKEQLAVWDRWMVPLSRIIDPVIGYSIGKTIVGIWQKPAA